MKKAMMWYLKWTVIGNGCITLVAFLIGNMIRAGWLGDNGLTDFLRWYNDCTMLVLKSTKKIELI